MDARTVLDIHKHLVDTAQQVLDCGDMVKRTEVYPDQALELERMYKRMMEILMEIKLEQAG